MTPGHSQGKLHIINIYHQSFSLYFQFNKQGLFFYYLGSGIFPKISYKSILACECVWEGL